MVGQRVVAGVAFRNLHVLVHTKHRLFMLQQELAGDTKAQPVHRGDLVIPAVFDQGGNRFLSEVVRQVVATGPGENIASDEAMNPLPIDVPGRLLSRAGRWSAGHKVPSVRPWPLASQYDWLMKVGGPAHDIAALCPRSMSVAYSSRPEQQQRENAQASLTRRPYCHASDMERRLGRQPATWHSLYSVIHMQRLLSLLITTSCALLASTAAGAGQFGPQLHLFDRSAQGLPTDPGGARRISGDMTDAYLPLFRSGEVRNVILLIGDGMGDSEITLARNYAEGAGGSFKGIDALPISGQYTHYSLERETGKPVYVTDSAASATAWASGVKTYNGAIGVDVRGRTHRTLIELAKAAGLGTGNVSTAALQDATPAAQIAHVALRSCQAPAATSEHCPRDAIENGGPGSISEQLLQARADVTLGGGMQGFREVARGDRWRGRTLADQARARGFNLIKTADALAAVRVADDRSPLLGLFAEENMPIRWQGPQASYNGNLEKPPVTCAVNPARTSAIPTLAAMTSKAIELLKDKPKGFFLQVEGASIDKQDHAANPCGQIGETVDLDEAVQVALDFARKDGRTLVIVTADHAHSSQIVANGTRAPGRTQALTTKDGAVMTVSYGIAESGSQGHTGTQLRVAAYGPRAANLLGLTDQTDLFYTIRDALPLGGN